MIHQKIGFIGMGSLAQSMVKGFIDNKVLTNQQIFASNRTYGKLQKMVDTYQIHGCKTNEEVIDQTDIVILAMKPQDLPTAIESLTSSFTDNQIVISLAAGFTIHALQKMIPQARIIRVMPNIPMLIHQGVIGYSTKIDDGYLDTVVEDLFKSLGSVFKAADDDQFEALTIACASGTGFVFELMLYWQDWIQERGFEPKVAQQMTVDTFLGAAKMASIMKDQSLEELQNRVASRKGVTAAGLQSMRELEIERTLRYSFEKASLRNQELAKES